MSDDLGDRMKLYERVGATEQLMPRLPIIVRLDGRAFHTFTKGLNKPFDTSFQALMDRVALKLVEETNAVIGYVQSDEISLVLYVDGPRSKLYFDGRRDKINSVLASLTAVTFHDYLEQYLPEKVGRGYALFDCRCFTVPSKIEATNVLIWREQDAARNAVSMAAQAKFSHTELQGKSSSEMQEMLFSKHGINFNDYPDGCKRGRYFQRRTVEVPFSDAARARLAGVGPSLEPGATYERKEVKMIHLPIFTKIINRVEVTFDGANPQIAD